MQEIISLHHIEKVFRKKKVLKDISFSIPKGSICAFLGPNGAGKSTLLLIIMQLLVPTSGEVRMNGHKVLKHKIGFVFQENTFDEELTVYENLMIRGKLYDLSTKTLKQKILSLSQAFGMNSFLYKNYKICSGGEKRMAMIARALLMDPEIIIMDEPTTALDLETRKKVWDFLLKLNKEKGVAIFFSSHYIEEAEVATNLCILKEGRIIFTGTYPSLIERYSKKHLQIQYKNHVEKKEISSIESAFHYLEQVSWGQVDTFSVTNSNLEDIFLKLIHYENLSS